jgi:hypothetical protein
LAKIIILDITALWTTFKSRVAYGSAFKNRINSHDHPKIVSSYSCRLIARAHSAQ